MESKNVINNSLLEIALSIKTDQEISCSGLGLVATYDQPNMLTFLDDEKFLQQIYANCNISAIFVTKELNLKLKSAQIKTIVCDDPRYYFYSLMNYLGKMNYCKKATTIHRATQIHRKAFICEYNVEIGPNVIVEPNVAILADVIVGQNCIIRAGAVIGSEGFEYKRTSKGIIPVFHDGSVIMGNNVVIGANNAVAKGFSFRHTIIGDETKLDNQIHIAHGDHIGKRCLIAASAMIAGTVTIGDDVWIGPGASISSGITIGDKARITIGSVVTKDVPAGQTVTGNFAIPHDKFIENLRKLIK